MTRLPRIYPHLVDSFWWATSSERGCALAAQRVKLRASGDPLGLPGLRTSRCLADISRRRDYE
jgi:hypothetical protein